MTSLCRHVGAGLAVVWLGSFLYADFSYPPEKRGDMEARLTVQAADKTAVQGHGEVTLTLSISGPPTLEVEEPHLDDPTAAWKEKRRTSKRVTDEKQLIWSQVIRLKQLKQGITPVPDVSVRFRESPDGSWEEAKWVDILKQPRDVPSPPLPPSPPKSWLHRWGLFAIMGLVGALVVGVWMVKRQRAGQTPPLPPDEWALRELECIEQTLLPLQGDSEAYHTQLSHVVRHYLAERFGLHALQQTTAEFLETIHQAPQLSVEQQTLLREFFERCDLAKFARASTPPEECQRTVELARELVRQTTAEKQTNANGSSLLANKVREPKDE